MESVPEMQVDSTHHERDDLDSIREKRAHTTASGQDSLSNASMPLSIDNSQKEAQNLLHRGKYVRQDEEPIHAGYRFPKPQHPSHAINKTTDRGPNMHIPYSNQSLKDTSLVDTRLDETVSTIVPSEEATQSPTRALHQDHRPGDVIRLDFSHHIDVDDYEPIHSDNNRTEPVQKIQESPVHNARLLFKEPANRPMKRLVSPQQTETQLQPQTPTKVSKHRNLSHRAKTRSLPILGKHRKTAEQVTPSEEDLYSLLQFRSHQNKIARDVERATRLAKEAELDQMSKAYEKLREQLQILQTQDQERQDELSKYRRALPSWKAKVYRFQDTLRDMKQDHDEMRSEMTKIKGSKKDIEGGQAEIRALIEDAYRRLDRTKTAKTALLGKANHHITELHDHLVVHEADAKLRNELINHERQRNDTLEGEVSKLSRAQGQILTTMNENQKMTSKSLETLLRHELNLDGLATAAGQDEVRSILKHSVPLLEELKNKPVGLLQGQEQMLARIKNSQELTNSLLESLPRTEYNVEGLATSTAQDEIKSVLENTIELLQELRNKPIVEKDDLQRLDRSVGECTLNLSIKMDQLAEKSGSSIKNGVEAIGELSKQVKNTKASICAERSHTDKIAALERAKAEVEESLRQKAAETLTSSMQLEAIQENLSMLRERNARLEDEVSSWRAKPKIDPSVARQLNEAEQCKMATEAELFELQKATDERATIFETKSSELKKQIDTLKTQLEQSEIKVQALNIEKDAVAKATFQRNQLRAEQLRTDNAEQARRTAKHEASMNELRLMKESETNRATELEEKLRSSLQAFNDEAAKSGRLEEQEASLRSHGQNLQRDNTRLQALLLRADNKTMAANNKAAALSLVIQNQDRFDSRRFGVRNTTMGTQTFQSPKVQHDIGVQTFCKHPTRPKLVASLVREAAEESQDLLYNRRWTTTGESQELPYGQNMLDPTELVVEETTQENSVYQDRSDSILSSPPDSPSHQSTLHCIQEQTSPVGDTSALFPATPVQSIAQQPPNLPANSSARRVHKTTRLEPMLGPASQRVDVMAVDRQGDLGTKRKRTPDEPEVGPRAKLTPDRSNKFAKDQSEPRSILKDTGRSLAEGSQRSSGRRMSLRRGKIETRGLGSVIADSQSPPAKSSQKSVTKRRTMRRQTSSQGTESPNLAQARGDDPDDEQASSTSDSSTH